MVNQHRIASVVMIAFAVMLIVIAPASAKQKKSGESREAQAIRAVLTQQVEAWNRRDLEGFMRGYWNSPDLTFFSGGMLTSGWKLTLDRYHDRYMSAGHEMGHLEFSDLKIERLGPQSAFVRGHWQLKMSQSETGGLFTLIFRKFPDGWKIIHDHTGASS